MTRHKSALITGASRGIGEAFARALPSDTNLILCGRDESALSELSGALTTDRRAVRIVVADLSKADGRDRVVRTAEDAHIDLLINNAGIGKFGGFLDVERDDHLETVDVNISAILDFTHRLVPGMIARARSSRRAGLINVASSAAFAPVPKFAVYAASKAFVLSFSEALTAELRVQPIDILAFCPGAVWTEFGRTAGYRQGNVPGAMGTGVAARAALRALGHRRTLVLDKLGAIPFGAAALGRAALAEIINLGLGRSSGPMRPYMVSAHSGKHREI
jgi:hypothetical protein